LDGAGHLDAVHRRVDRLRNTRKMPTDEECIVWRKHPVVEKRKWRFELRRPRRYLQKRALLRERDERTLAVDERQINKGLRIGRPGKRNATERGAGGDQKPRSIQGQTPSFPGSRGRHLKMTLVTFLELGPRPLLDWRSLDGGRYPSAAGYRIGSFS